MGEVCSICGNGYFLKNAGKANSPNFKHFFPLRTQHFEE